MLTLTYWIKMKQTKCNFYKGFFIIFHFVLYTYIQKIMLSIVNETTQKSIEGAMASSRIIHFYMYLHLEGDTHHVYQKIVHH